MFLSPGYAESSRAAIRAAQEWLWKGTPVAKTVIVRAICDRCQAEGNQGVDSTEEVTFSYDGYSYGLDLCAAHAAAFHDTVQSMIDWSTDRSPVAPTRRQRSAATVDGAGRQPARRDPEQTMAIRQWANANGYQVSSRGRIPAEVEQAYNAR
ncbi:MAG: histone-like nucleoid-structuring protein Lsr2 [Acidimicrobiales bacterium]